jgi:hypothetical protein
MLSLLTQTVTGIVFCQTHFKEVDGVEASNVVNYNKPVEMYGTPMAIVDRRISLDTAKRYGVRQTIQSSITRTTTRTVSSSAPRFAQSRLRSSAPVAICVTILFGQQLFKTGGRYVTVVEGELDALAAL